MTDKKAITFHAGPELRDRLKDHSDDTGAPQSEIIRRALRAYLPPVPKATNKRARA